jgi:thiamine biosynthesis lipoprotein
MAVSTSGNYEKFFEKDNKKYCHIINPKTGQAISDSSNSLASVTIIANKTVDADAYATAVFVLGAKDGQNLIRKLGYQGILITNDGKMIEVK